MLTYLRKLSSTFMIFMLSIGNCKSLMQIFNAPKCTNYRMYKSEFGLEKYFTILRPDLMYNMCKFRCGSHKLPIEMGRFLSIDRSERICDLCNNEELGDEFYYLFNYTFFKDEREKMYS